MAKNLVIVESPAKAGTITKILGSDFEVRASYGHIIEIPKDGKGVKIEEKDTENLEDKYIFSPVYQLDPAKKRNVNELKSLAKKAEKVWLATDEDREGEAIARHVARELGLSIENTPRIVFHEITEKAIKNAVANPRTIDMKFVDAQQARSVLDYLVWFKLSPVLWRKVVGWISAWRVQSVAVRLIVEREREIEQFNATSSFKTVGTFTWNTKKNFPATLDKEFKKNEEVLRFLDYCKTATFTVENVEQKPWKRSPSAPFTTSTLQQEASRKLGFSPSRTMQLAQKLYEAGKITYMRTDSVNLSQDAMNAAKQEITKDYGEKYSNPTAYKTKSAGAQEAHECIRPAHLEIRKAGEDASQQKLYDLIRKRTIASQMASANIEKTVVTIDISGAKSKFVAEGEVVTFDGFLKVYSEGTDDEESSDVILLPKLEKGETLQMEQIASTQKFKKHAPRYTEASLVKELEKRGIGRPSTYATIVTKIQDRKYVVKESREGEKRDYLEFLLKNGEVSESKKSQNTGVEKEKLFPTQSWRDVTDFLIANFENIMDYNFTASVETDFDQIAEGEKEREKVVSLFYGPFNEAVVRAQGAERVITERELWEDPETWKKVIARSGRYGPFIQIGDPEEKKYASIPDGKSLETITLEEALKCFTLPREVGEYEGEKITAAIGRFWPYLKYQTFFVSIPKNTENPLDPYTITLEDAIPLIQAKLDKEKSTIQFEYEGEKIELKEGPYGPYLKFKKKNYKIPKSWKDMTDYTLEDCLSLIGKDLGKEEKSGAKTKKSAKTTKTSKTTKTKKK